MELIVFWLCSRSCRPERSLFATCAENVLGAGPVPVPVLFIYGPDNWSLSWSRSFLVPIICPGLVSILVPVLVRVLIPVLWLCYWNIHINNVWTLNTVFGLLWNSCFYRYYLGRGLNPQCTQVSSWHNIFSHFLIVDFFMDTFGVLQYGINLNIHDDSNFMMAPYFMETFHI